VLRAGVLSDAQWRGPLKAAMRRSLMGDGRTRAQRRKVEPCPIQGSATNFRLLVSNYGRGGGRTIRRRRHISPSAQSTLQTGFGHLLREQPLRWCSWLPPVSRRNPSAATEMEERTLHGARWIAVLRKVRENLIEVHDAASDWPRNRRTASKVQGTGARVGEKLADRVTARPRAPARAEQCLSLPTRGLMARTRAWSPEGSTDAGGAKIDLEVLRAPETFSSFKEEVIGEARQSGTTSLPM